MWPTASILTPLVLLVSAASIRIVTDDDLQWLGSFPGVLLVQVGASWCPRTTAVAPQFEAAVNVIRGFSADVIPRPNIEVGQLDGDSSPTCRSNWLIKGYPTIAILSNHGKLITRYLGERTADGIANWALRTIGPAVKAIRSEAVAAKWGGVLSPLFSLYCGSHDTEILRIFESIGSELAYFGVFTVVQRSDIHQPRLLAFRGDEHRASEMIVDPSVEGIAQIMRDFLFKSGKPLIVMRTSKKEALSFMARPRQQGTHYE